MCVLCSDEGAKRYMLREVTLQVTDPFGGAVIGCFPFLLRSKERCSLGVNDAGVRPSISIAFSEALEGRGPGTETCVSALGIRCNFGAY